MAFYTGGQFPVEYNGSAFACFHGSWNRDHRTGYKVVNVPMKDGKAVGNYMDFMTGFVNADGTVWGRPVGVTQGVKGDLFVTDDGSNSVWKVTYTKK
jgi:glucose/arabinose dehydrogenase